VKLRLDRKWLFVASVSVLFGVTAVALTLLTARRSPAAAADRLREAGRYSEALDRYQDVLARDPDNGRALWGVAQVHLARGAPDMALEYLNRYLRAHPRGKHAREVRQALARVRESYVAARKPSPELTPGPAPTPPAMSSSRLEGDWQDALSLEGRGALLDAITAYAGIVQTTEDPRVRAACLERIARCEARHPPFDFQRIRHFYLEAARAYRDMTDWQNSARCQELAYLAEEYARVDAARKQLAAEVAKVEAARPKDEAAKAPTPKDVAAEALAAYRAGEYDKALAKAREVLDKEPTAGYVIGLVHVRQALWDDARAELGEFVEKVPEGAQADEARRQLADIEGKRPLLVDDFRAGAKRWQLAGADAGTAPATGPAPSPTPSDGPCLKLEPGQKTYASVDEARVSTIEIVLRIPPDGGGPLPGVTIRLYSKDGYTCDPLFIGARGVYFSSQGAAQVPRTPGWRRLVIDVAPDTVTAHVDGKLIGEVPREAGFTGLSIEADRTPGGVPLYVDEVRVVEPT
jgi:tetratricopeptide (TPR) repeat protein